MKILNIIKNTDKENLTEKSVSTKIEDIVNRNTVRMESQESGDFDFEDERWIGERMVETYRNIAERGPYIVQECMDLLSSAPATYVIWDKNKRTHVANENGPIANLEQAIKEAENMLSETEYEEPELLK